MSYKIPKIPRRVVTGHRDGVATIIEDKQVTHVMKNEAGFIISDPWATDNMPVKQEQSAEIFDEFFPKLHQNGTLFRYVYIPPDSQTKQFFPEKEGQPHPLMHKTDTLDYIIILSGELYLIMEDCETLLKPGDIVIQCGTNHAWSNRTNEACIQLAILLDSRGA
ncbi:MAG TPA: cupin domain-containing protein [Flavobacteriaceae bacterium]|nr:cupin [Legionellales bacterium]MAZ39233.1 cupin [Legionellales bacterium]MAZ40188.1 cupin [Legionellales bacterium]HAT67204.1 cupin domain-containing protein [Flavobacteriaceae bacterium]|tara:strand:+ start:4583 stop:5074 length:492 start_codon:yes stop_codon:yes gene_type:complete